MPFYYLVKALIPNDVTAYLIIAYELSCPVVRANHVRIMANRVHRLISLSEDDVSGAKFLHPSVNDNALVQF